jgi:hypothetical protein
LDGLADIWWNFGQWQDSDGCWNRLASPPLKLDKAFVYSSSTETGIHQN